MLAGADGRLVMWSVVGVLISIWSVAHGRWSVVGDWSVGGGFVLRPKNTVHISSDS